MKLLVINGPNLNLLGLREPEIYGRRTYQDLLSLLRQTGKEEGVEVECFQSNHEGAIVDAIQQAYGVAILDALKAVALPAVEVHISAVSSREPFRQISYAGMACVRTYQGLGFDGYMQAIRFLKQLLEVNA